jgi:hypothetical protein
MEHLQLNSTNLAEEYFRAAEGLNALDPLLLNELGVVAYNKEEWVQERSEVRFDVLIGLDTTPRSSTSAKPFKRPRKCRESLQYGLQRIVTSVMHTD